MSLLVVTLALSALAGQSASPATSTAPRLDFIDEICTYDWEADRWGCDAARLRRVPVETIEVDAGALPLEVRAQRWAADDAGEPTLLKPEERGQDPDNWGPKPLWACISGVAVEVPEGVEVAWGEATWAVDGREQPAVVRERAGRTLVQTPRPPCVGPRLLFQSDQSLRVSLSAPYRHDGERSELTWRYRVERAGVTERTAMLAVTPPRRWRGPVPERPEERKVGTFFPTGTCIGGAATAVGLTATFLGAQANPPAPSEPPWALASAAVAALPLAAGLAVDGTLLGLWVSEGIEHFRYDIAKGTEEHWDRSRIAYERRMRELGLEIPADY